VSVPWDALGGVAVAAQTCLNWREITILDEKLLQSLEWRLIGPHRAGRVVAVAGDPNEGGTFYFGGCAGGVWKTTSGGSYWENVTDGFLKTSAIGALAVAH